MANLWLTRRRALGYLGVTGLATGWSSVAGGDRGAARPDHHAGQGFRNPFPIERRTDRGFLDFMRWQLGLGPDETPALPPERVPSYRPNGVDPDLRRIANPDPAAVQVTWIGHATFLIQHAGLNFLTDPMFGRRASPVSFAGPERLAPPGLAFKDLPRIDVVLSSHNHYDHLDLGTVERLGNGPAWAVALGNRPWFRELGIDNVREFDWWDHAEFRNVRIHAVPAQHFSGRTIADRNQTLWCGWVVESEYGRFYFAGDSGYGPFFKDIGERFGGFDLSLVPVGAYQPRWFMSPVHCDAAEAVLVHRDVRSRRSIGMHWGTFRLTTEPAAEPPLYLAAAAERAGLKPDDFTVMAFGETRAAPTETGASAKNVP